MGFQTTGTASEYFAVDASKVTPIPEDVDEESGQYLSLYPRTPYHGLCSAENPYPGMYGAAS